MEILHFMNFLSNFCLSLTEVSFVSMDYLAESLSVLVQAAEPP